MADRSGSRPGLCGAFTLFDIVIKTRRDTRAAGLGTWLMAMSSGLLLSSLFRDVAVFLAERLAGEQAAFHAVRKTRLKQGPTLIDGSALRGGLVRLT